jgi:hypothetical protein
METDYKTVSVICALYIGERPVHVNNIIDDKLYYFYKQLEYLNTYKNKIFKFYFITTFQDEIYFKKYKNILDEYTDTQIEIIFKANLGGSYTSWKTGLDIDNGKSDLIFLIEDDYVVYNEKSIDNIVFDFEEDSELFYYCGLWVNEPKTINNKTIKSHAAISNGIINNKMYHSSPYEFDTVDKIKRVDLFLNQITFLEPFRLSNYKIKDYTFKYSSIFSHGVNKMQEFGIAAGDVIIYPLTKI